MTTKEFGKKAIDVALFVASQVALYFTVQYVLDSLQNKTDARSADAKIKGNKIMERLGKSNLELTHYEEIIAAEVIHPDDIHIRFSDVGGLESIVSNLRESVIYPLCYPELFAAKSNLISAPKGVLLYGPPGCGKTMLAKALAKESGATFINITASVIQDKWFGESNKLVAGLFSLARKLQPCIIFIDEIDSFLRERSRGDHEVTAMMKAEFMTCVSGSTVPVVESFAVPVKRRPVFQFQLSTPHSAMASSSSEEEPIPSPTHEFSKYQATLQKAAVESGKFAAALPSKNDLSFQRTVDRKLGTDLDACSSRILGLASQLLGFISAEQAPSAGKGKGKARQLVDDEDVVERYHELVIDALDRVFENVDSCLDEFSGKKTLAVPPTEKPAAKQRAEVASTSEPHPYRYEIANLEYPPTLFERTNPRPVNSFEDTPFTWIDTPAGLSAMLEKLKVASDIAVDLEHHDYRSFHGFVCLMQISTRDEDFIVDTLSIRDELVVLNEVFADPNIVKVFHGAKSDITWLQRDFNLYVVNLFDTYHASVQLGLPKKSLAFLLMKYCDFAADKRYQLADWRIRPLPEEMLFYARSDTHFLLYVADCLRNELLDQAHGQPNNILDVLHNSTTTALNVHLNEDFSKESAHFLARKWNKGLWGKQLAVYEALYEWRVRVAREEDESIRYVLPNQFLFTLAERTPKDATQLLSVVQPTPPLIRSRAIELINTIKKAITDYGMNEARKAEERKAIAARGAMDVDSGPFANISLNDDGRPIDSPSSAGALFEQDSEQIPFVATESAFFGKIYPSKPTISDSLHHDIVQKIHSTLVITPSVPEILKTAKLSKAVPPTSQGYVHPEPTIPNEPEQIPFEPASQRQTLSTKFADFTSTPAKHVEMDDEEVVEVRDPELKRKSKNKQKKERERQDTKSQLAKMSLLAAAAPPASVSLESAGPSTLVLAGKTLGDDEKLELKKRKREEKERKKQEAAEALEAVVPYDYGAAPNPLDEGLDELGTAGVPPKKRKVGKGEKKKGKQAGSHPSSFPAPPRQLTMPKSGNKSMTFKS
ncbi:exosome nuclease subunit [Tulasnella sp. 417]|nr:exosome nuclease subunit [Tulasnella sp. 417]